MMSPEARQPVMVRCENSQEEALAPIAVEKPPGVAVHVRLGKLPVMATVVVPLIVPLVMRIHRYWTSSLPISMAGPDAAAVEERVKPLRSRVTLLAWIEMGIPSAGVA